MEKNVMYCYVLFLVFNCIHARVAVTDLDLPIVSNEIGKDNVVTESSNPIETTTNNSVQEAAVVGNDEKISNSSIVENSKEPADINDNFIDTNQTVTEPVPLIDNGTALILTPYIKEGKIDEARNTSKVNPDLFLGVESYSGFFTVNATYDSNIFFWYFPVENKPVNETPWIIWLQGGPGASSLAGLFEEIGPFTVDGKKNMKRNPNTWIQDHSLLFIDNPVGTGYSFTNDNNGYVTDKETYAKHLYSTLKQFLQIFPELRTTPLFVAGESYAGKYVPALGMEIHKHKHTPGGDINLQGLVIGNAFVEPSMIWDITRSYYQFGLLDKEQLEVAQPLVDAFHADIAANRSVEAKEKFNALVVLLLHMSSQKHAYNFLHSDLRVGKYLPFLHEPEIKKAIHVGDIKPSFVNFTVNMKLAPDFLSDARPMFEELLEHYQVLAYCGQLDQMLTCPVAAEHHRRWKWGSSELFHNATRFSFLHDGKLAGYYKSGGGFTEVVLTNAGHMAAMDAPEAARGLLERWTRRRLPIFMPLLPQQTLRDYVTNQTLPRHGTGSIINV